MKKKIGLFIMLGIFLATIAFADTYVSGYYRSNGTYVKPHYRSSPNSSQYDNWSSKGNTNPYTGKKGYRTPSTSIYGNRGSYGTLNNSSGLTPIW